MGNVDYNFGDQPGMGNGESEGEDNREDYRLSGSASVRLELESEMPDADGRALNESRTLVCHIRDFSAQGLCLIVPETLTPGALLSACVSLGAGQDEFALTVEVVWCRADDNNLSLAGVEIQDSDDTSYVDWVEAAARAMAED
ncbi:PilZ domain-containing protein [Marinobacter sp.]|uniref:PilZ domain-containing protein n=1 Tax=Marinobacter sp. TaxID=50741 RepID=UPI0034A2B4E8